MILLLQMEVVLNIAFLLLALFVVGEEFVDHLKSLKNGIRYKHIILSILFPIYLLIAIGVIITFGCSLIWDKSIIDFNKKK